MHSRQFTQYILGLVFLATSSLALSNTEFTYSVIDGGIEVTGCAGSCPSDLVIPEEIDGFIVKSVGEFAFSSKNLTSLALPDSIIRIEMGAFQSNSLLYLLLPENLIYLAPYSFAFNNISSLSISNSVEVIGQSALQSNELTHVIIPSGVSYIGFWSFGINPLTSIIFYGSRPDISRDTFVDKPEFGDFISLTSISYCDEDNGWPGEPIEGITPEFDENCSITNEQNEPITYSVFDIDQNGSIDALTDGLIILRYFFGIRGSALIENAVNSNANRTSAADIEAYIESHMP